MFAGLDLCALAGLFGMTPRAFVALAESDRRIVKMPSPGAAFRVRRWITDGSPIADLTRIEFAGADSVRAIVLDVLRNLPMPVQHYAIEAVTWAEVGRGTAAWMYRMSPRALSGDVGHMIAINGRETDACLPGIVAHEIAHGWHRTVVDVAPPHSTLTEREAIGARHLHAVYTAGIEEAASARERYIRACIARERIADRQAEAWGVPHHGPNELELRRHFAAQYDDAATTFAAGVNQEADALAASIEGP